MKKKYIILGIFLTILILILVIVSVFRIHSKESNQKSIVKPIDMCECQKKVAYEYIRRGEFLFNTNINLLISNVQCNFKFFVYLRYEYGN